MVSALTHKMVQLHSSRLLEHVAAGSPIPSARSPTRTPSACAMPFSAAKKVFSVGLYVLLRASSLATLDDLTRRVEVTLDGMLAHSRVAIFEQDAGFLSCLPGGQDPPGLPQPRHVVARDDLPVLVQHAHHGARRPLWDREAQRLASHLRPVRPEPGERQRRLRQVGRQVVLHQADGAANLLFGVDFLVIDPEDEYRTLCDAIGGQYVRLASN